VHEATHQLNHEVADLGLRKWLEEGLATYYSTSRIEDGELHLGRVDTNAYPVWWLDQIATSGTMAEDLENGSFLPLETIVKGRGGPSMRKHFNLYYLHWWTLVHFLEERSSLAPLLKEGGSLDAVCDSMGSPELVQERWYAHVLRLKEQCTGSYTPRVQVEPHAPAQ
jgi:hypothetical protein